MGPGDTMKNLLISTAATLSLASTGFAYSESTRTYMISSPVEVQASIAAQAGVSKLTALRQAISSVQTQILFDASQMGISIDSQLQHLNAISFAKMSRAEAAQMRALGYGVYENGIYRIVESDSSVAAETIPYGIEKVRATEAWSSATGAGVKVCVIDTGLDTDHPDLASNFVEGISTVGAGSSNPDDVQGHGTHVAGTIAAANNGSGVVGVAPDASLYIAAVFGRRGTATSQDILEGLDWCVGKGADVISMSYGGGASSNAEQQAYQNAHDAGIVMVAATGNSGARAPISFPARYDVTIAVGATDQNDQIASFSQRGAELDVVAPGVGTVSTRNGGGTTTLSGTSMATPHVSGAAAALLSANPSLSNEDVRRILRESAVDLGSPGRDNTYGHGRIDVVAALELAGGGGGGGNQPPVADFSFTLDAENPFQVYFEDSSRDSDGSISSWSWDFGDGNSSSQRSPIHTYGSLGTYNVTLTVTDNEGAERSTSQEVVVLDSSLGNGVPRSNLSGARGEEIRYTIEVPADATNLSFQLSGGTGDADLYVSFGSEPTTGSYDCRPYRNGNNETCSFTNPQEGRYYVMLRGYRAFSGAELVASYESDGGGSPGPDPSDIELSLSSGGFWFWNWVDVAWDGAQGDEVDIYRNGSLLTTTANDGSYRNQTARGTYSFKVCEAGSDTACSDEQTISF